MSYYGATQPAHQFIVCDNDTAGEVPIDGVGGAEVASTGDTVMGTEKNAIVMVRNDIWVSGGDLIIRNAADSADLLTIPAGSSLTATLPIQYGMRGLLFNQALSFRVGAAGAQWTVAFDVLG